MRQRDVDVRMAIIDFQAFLGKNRNFIVKELCVAPVSNAVDNQETCFQFWTFKTPQHFRHCSSENKYVERYYHGMSFDYGDIPFPLLLPILRKTINDYDYLFVKGLEKSCYLSSLLNRLVYDLNVLKCARNFSSLQSCIYHCGTTFTCAVRNCISNRDWFTKFLNDEISRLRIIKTRQSDLSLAEPVTHWETTFAHWDLQEYCMRRITSFSNSSSLRNREKLADFFHDFMLSRDV